MENKNTPRVMSGASLIGWLSVCLLAAAYGRSLDERWQQIWAQAGAFGLAAALGLGSIERLRTSREQRTRDKEQKARAEFGLTRLHQHSATIDSINSAVRKLAQQAALDMRGKLGRAQRNRRRDQIEMLSDYPLEITPIDEQSENHPTLPPITGVLHQITSRIVSFEHNETIPTRTVLLSFRVSDTRLSFVVDVTWTQKLDGIYSSGGTVLAVGVPDEEAELAAAT